MAVRSIGPCLLVAALVGAVALVALRGYTTHQLAALQGASTYSSPEEGMREMAAEWYVGLNRVDIVHGGFEPCFLNNLYFVEARVWADGRIDGKMTYADGDNPGGFFLRRGDDWVRVAEERRPWFIAFGQWLFGDG